MDEKQKQQAAGDARTQTTGFDLADPSFVKVAERITNGREAEAVLGAIGRRCKTAGLPIENAKKTLDSAYAWQDTAGR